MKKPGINERRAMEKLEIIHQHWEENPYILVSEISRILINERKRILISLEKHLPKTIKKINVIDLMDIQFEAIREKLELRRRSKKGI